jgi:hypothetical protein
MVEKQATMYNDLCLVTYTQGKWQESNIRWLTHPPATYKTVKQYQAQPYSDFDWDKHPKE